MVVSNDLTWDMTTRQMAIETFSKRNIVFNVSLRKNWNCFLIFVTEVESVPFKLNHPNHLSIFDFHTIRSITNISSFHSQKVCKLFWIIGSFVFWWANSTVWSVNVWHQSMFTSALTCSCKLQTVWMKTNVSGQKL